MAKIEANIYDIAYPSPVPLRDLSSIAVAIQLWRLDQNEHRSKNKPKICLRDVLPGVPSAINHITSKCLDRLVNSISDWFKFHHDNIANDILNNFDDIVADFDGTVHYTRTAERMMLSDQISQVEKFKIACMYSFEDSIKQIWPFVKGNLDLNKFDFDNNPVLYYWMCRLRNELTKIPNHDDTPIDDVMLHQCPTSIRSSLEYFWNRASLQSRYELAAYLCLDCRISFCGRFILPKLNEQQLSAIVAEKGSDLVFYIWSGPAEDKQYALPIWMHIKDKMNKMNFTDLVQRMLIDESVYYISNDASIEKSDHDEKYYNIDNLRVSCEIWNTAATNLKRSAIENLLSKEWLYKKSEVDLYKPKEIRFITTVLHDATLKERRAFWIQNWLNFLTLVRLADFNRLMKLCLGNEKDIRLFKNSTLMKFENLQEIMKTYFKCGHFKELSNLLDFCCSDTQTGKDIKRQFLRSNVFGQSSVLCNVMGYEPKLFHEFIDDAYAGSPELAVDFRNEVVAWLETDCNLVWRIENGSFSIIKEFVTSFAMTGQNVERLKKRIANELKDRLVEGDVELNYAWVDNDNAARLQDFLVWCLGSHDQVIKFKQSLSSPDEILHNIVRNQKSSDRSEYYPDPSPELVSYPRSLDAFLSWYFNTPQEMNEFKTRMADVFKTLAPPSVRRF